MGGKALPGVQRLSAQTHRELQTRLVPSLRKHFALVGVPRSLANKRSHGDLDLVVSGQVPVAEARKLLQSELGARASVANGAMISFNVDGFQVDVTLLHTKPAGDTTGPTLEVDARKQAFNAYIGFMDFGDFSRILGMLLTPRGLRWTSSGLLLDVRAPETISEGNSEQKQRQQHQHDTRRIASLPLTQSIPDALLFLRYDPAPWIDGFIDETHMFDFLVRGSPWFDRDAFARVVQGKAFDRPVMRMFLEYLAVEGGSTCQGGGVGGDDIKEASKVLMVNQDGLGNSAVEEPSLRELALHHFLKQDEYHRILAEYARQREFDERIKSQFNGELIARILGIDVLKEGRLVGQVKRAMQQELEQGIMKPKIGGKR
ncbi:hypothetical protein BC830DRAFT_1082482 [Chytriomyces sp. MP71]|nr:hypothetical protein BC830DRAFT_1082482 [Chytriomyces sp. MP71]